MTLKIIILFLFEHINEKAGVVISILVIFSLDCLETNTGTVTSLYKMSLHKIFTFLTKQVPKNDGRG